MCCVEFEMSAPLDLTKLKVLPLAQRRSLARLEDILIDADSAPPPCSEANLTLIRQFPEAPGTTAASRERTP